MFILYILLGLLVLYGLVVSLLCGALAMNVSNKADVIEDYQKILEGFLKPVIDETTEEDK